MSSMIAHITAKMRPMADPDNWQDYDAEQDHFTADALLCDAVVYLADLAGCRPAGQELVDLWEKVGKWYA